ncbi:MAG: glycosyltransferase family 39 protein [Candidatus Diapherotrites archaeon]
MKPENVFQEKKLLFLALILLLAFSLRVFNLADRQPGVDEELTIRVTKSFGDALLFSNSDFYPPLSYIFMVPIISFFGAFGARIVFALAGVLAVFLFYLLAKNFFPEREALLSTLLFALNPLNVFYSVNLRQYIFLLVLCLAAMIAIISLLKKFSWKPLAALCISLVLMGFINYVCWAYAVAAALFALIFLRKKDYFKKCAAGISLVFLLFALLLPLALSQFGNFSKSQYYAGSAFNPAIYPYALYKFVVGVNISSAIDFFPPLLLAVPLVLGLASYGLFLFWKEKSDSSKFIAFFFIVSAAILALGSLKAPMLFSFRYLFPLMPAFILFLSKGIFALKGKKAMLAAAAVLLFWLMAVAYYYSVSSMPDWNALIGL